jgi:hypothetical protein
LEAMDRHGFAQRSKPACLNLPIELVWNGNSNL